MDAFGGKPNPSKIRKYPIKRHEYPEKNIQEPGGKSHEFGLMRFGVNAPKVENVCGARFNTNYFEYHRIADLPSSTLPDSPFILALGTPTAQNAPPQTGTLAQRALEEWERTLVRKQGSCDPCTDASRPTALIQKDGAKCSLPLSLTGHLRTPRHTVQETNWDAQREKACVNTYAHASASQICLQNICGQQQNFPMAGPTFGSKSGPQNGAQAKT